MQHATGKGQAGCASVAWPHSDTLFSFRNLLQTVVKSSSLARIATSVSYSLHNFVAVYTLARDTRLRYLTVRISASNRFSSATAYHIAPHVRGDCQRRSVLSVEPLVQPEIRATLVLADVKVDRLGAISHHPCLGRHCGIVRCDTQARVCYRDIG